MYYCTLSRDMFKPGSYPKQSYFVSSNMQLLKKETCAGFSKVCYNLWTLVKMFCSETRLVFKGCWTEKYIHRFKTKNRTTRTEMAFLWCAIPKHLCLVCTDDWGTDGVSFPCWLHSVLLLLMRITLPAWQLIVITGIDTSIHRLNPNYCIEGKVYFWGVTKVYNSMHRSLHTEIGKCDSVMKYETPRIWF